MQLSCSLAVNVWLVFDSTLCAAAVKGLLEAAAAVPQQPLRAWVLLRCVFGKEARVWSDVCTAFYW